MCTKQQYSLLLQYDMSITTETNHPQPQAQPIPPAATAYPTTVTQRRPTDYEQGSGQLTGAGAGQYAGSGQYTGAGQSWGSGGFNGSVQNTGAGQFTGTGAANGGSGPVSNVAEQGYSSSPRFSSTPVDWGSSAAPTTAATGPSYINPGTILDLHWSRDFSGHVCPALCLLHACCAPVHLWQAEIQLRSGYSLA